MIEVFAPEVFANTLPDLRRIPATSCHLAILSSDQASKIPGAVHPGFLLVSDAGERHPSAR